MPTTKEKREEICELLLHEILAADSCRERNVVIDSFHHFVSALAIEADISVAKGAKDAKR